VEKIGSTTFLKGAPDFQNEKLTAYEVGARIQPSSRTSFSVSTFYNVYDDLRSIELTPVSFIPLRWGNLMQGYTYGLEAWGDYRVAPWWRLSASANLLDKHLKFKPGASGLLGVQQAGDDPKHQASLKSSMNLGRDVTLDADLRYVGALPDPHVPSYVELNARLGWNLSKCVEISLSGFNLLHDHHQEFPAPQSSAVPRSFTLDLQWRF
jgi:iron complex outermembrane receptor protein